MMRYSILLFVLGLLIVSCKPDTPAGPVVEVKDNGSTVITKADPNAPAFTPSDLPLPNACKLVSLDDIGRLMNIEGDDIEVKDGSAGSDHSKACFFKWIGNRPNAGILIQVQKNPVGDEFPGWATSFVESKRTMGESDFTGGSENFKYSILEGLGDDGAYSYEMGKYFWRKGNDYVYMLAFNEDMSESKQLSVAKQFGKIIMDNVSK